MLGINGKQWNDIQWTDVEEFLNEIEESFFFEFKKDEVSGAKLIKEIAALANTYGGCFNVLFKISKYLHKNI